MEKEEYELEYWKKQSKHDRGKLKNSWYERFYTTFFNLSKENYVGKRILDVGSGPRGSLDWIADEAHADGIDPCADEYKELNKVKMNLIQGEVESFQSVEKYDFVTSFNSLDHVNNIDKAISSIFSLLKPNGIFLLLSDIHREPTNMEPSAFNWDIIEKLKQNKFLIKRNDHYEKHRGGMYQSLDDPQKYDHNNNAERYGIIAVYAQKPNSKNLD
jgi:2-polyprenyl-3-methyl-5-hydroxy-6-metoxy-1,4-benzoquinol methylase|tara:strand:- start:390 stop:1034 length:645 start_codon:yes stop_codon:yes gene_type:complete